MTERPLPPDDTPPPEQPPTSAEPTDTPPPEQAPGVPEPTEPPPPPPPPSRPTIAAAGWTTSLLRGLLAFVIVLLVAELFAVITAFDSDLSAGDIAKLGAMTFFGVHHVGIKFDLSELDLSSFLGAVPGGGEGFPLPGGVSITVTVAIALLGLTILAAWLLYRGGRAAAEAGGGTPLQRMGVGASVGVPYAVLALVLSFLIEFRLQAPLVGPVVIGVSSLSAFLWPLGLGAVFGGMGGLASARTESRETGRWPAVVAGGGRMVVWGLVLGFVGLLVLAGANPQATADYFSGVADAGALDGIRIILLTAIILAPLMAVNLLYLGTVFAPFVFQEYLGTNSLTILSLLEFPKGAGALTELDPFTAATGAGVGPAPGELPFQTEVASWEYFFFVLALVAAVVIGGRYAARRAGAATAGEGAALGAGAGAVFAAASAFLIVMAGIGFKAVISFGLTQTVNGRLGVHLIFGILLTAVVAVVGGAAGGALGASGAAPAASTAGFGRDDTAPPA